MLAGLISNPEGNNPFINPDRAKAPATSRSSRWSSSTTSPPRRPRQPSSSRCRRIKPEAELRPRDSWAEEVQDRLFNDPLYKVLGATPEERKEAVLEGGLKVYADPRPERSRQNAQDAMNASCRRSPASPAAPLDGSEQRLREGDGRGPRASSRVSTTSRPAIQDAKPVRRGRSSRWPPRSRAASRRMTRSTARRRARSAATARRRTPRAAAAS